MASAPFVQTARYRWRAWVRRLARGDPERFAAFAAPAASLCAWIRRLLCGDPKRLAAVAVPALFLYTWLVIDPRLIHHGAGTISNFPVFKTGIASLLDSISRPGGAVEYASAFLAQLFAYSWLGAAVIVGLGWSLFRVTNAFLRLIGDPSLRFLRFAGPAALAITFARRQFEIQAYLDFVAAMGLGVVVCRRSSRLSILRLLAGSVAIYQLAGGAYIVYAVCCALYEGRVRGRRWSAIIVLSTLAWTPLALGVLVLGYGPWEAYTLLLPFSPGTLIHLLVPISPQTQGGLGDLDSLIAVLTAAGFYLLCVFPMLVKGLYSLVRPGPAASRPRASERGRQLRPSVIRFLALVAAVAGLALVPNQDRRNLIESDYLAYHGRWTELLHRAHRYSNDPLVLSSVNRALFHTGALADRMFEFPQTGGDVLLLGRDSQTPFDEGLESRAPRVWRRAELHMDLGLLEAAKTELVLLTDWIGPRPLVLRKLALIALSTGDLGAARIVLGELSKSLFDAGWAAEKLARLDNGDDLAADPEIRELRRRTRPTDGDSLLFEEDVFDTYLDDAKALERVHNENPNNRMAAEYLLAMRLLGRQLDAFVEELADNPELSGRPLPAHYQEAIVLYRESKEGQERTAQYVVDPRVVDRWTAYKSRSGNRTAADKTTYWSYYDAAAQTGAAQ